jgi:hypothetical protein
VSCGEVGVYEKEKTAKLLIYGNLERPVATGICKALHMRMKTAAAGRTRTGTSTLTKEGKIRM